MGSDSSSTWDYFLQVQPEEGEEITEHEVLSGTLYSAYSGDPSVAYTTTTSGTSGDALIVADGTQIQWMPNAASTVSLADGLVLDGNWQNYVRSALQLDKEDCEGTLIDFIDNLGKTISELQKIIKEQDMSIRRLEQKLDIKPDTKDGEDILTEGL